MAYISSFSCEIPQENRTSSYVQKCWNYRLIYMVVSELFNSNLYYRRSFGFNLKLKFVISFSVLLDNYCSPSRRMCHLYCSLGLAKLHGFGSGCGRYNKDSPKELWNQWARAVHCSGRFSTDSCKYSFFPST